MNPFKPFKGLMINEQQLKVYIISGQELDVDHVYVN